MLTQQSAYSINGYQADAKYEEVKTNLILSKQP
jgi:hypothetical protein